MEAVEPLADPDVAVVPLAGELDASDTGWANELDAAVDAGARKLVVDMLNVTFVDSSVIQALILARRRVGGPGWVRLVYTHHLIGRVVEICGLTETFPHYTTVDAALRDAPTRFGLAHGEGSQR